MWWNDHYLVKNADDMFSKFPDKEIKLWFAGSNAEDISQYTNTLNKTLMRNAPNKLEWSYSDEPKEEHGTIFRATKEKALKWTLSR